MQIEISKDDFVTFENFLSSKGIDYDSSETYKYKMQKLASILRKEMRRKSEEQ